MPINNYIPNLRHFYFGQGEAGLTDQVSTANWVEQGVVGLNSADGPPPDLTGTSRGPCSGSTASAPVGFQRTPSSDYLDLRTTGDITMLIWARLDSRSTSQELLGWYTTTANEQAMLYYYLHDSGNVQTPILQCNGVTNTISTGPGSVDLWTDTDWHLCGWSYDTTTDKVTIAFDDNVLTHTDPLGGFQHTVLTPARVGHTFTGVLGDGLLGDVAYFSVFDYAFDAEDYAFFYNEGGGRAFPNGYVRGSPSIIPFLAAIKARRKKKNG